MTDFLYSLFGFLPTPFKDICLIVFLSVVVSLLGTLVYDMIIDVIKYIKGL